MKSAVYATAGFLIALLTITIVVTVPVPIDVAMKPKVLLDVSAGGSISGESELLMLEGTKGVTYKLPYNPDPYWLQYSLNVTLYQFSKPLGVGSEANLSISLTSRLNESEAFFVAGWIGAIYLESGHAPLQDGQWSAGGLSFVDENPRWMWIGAIDAQSTKRFNLKLKTIEISEAELRIVAGRANGLEPGDWDPENIFPIKENCVEVSFDFTVLKDNVLVRLYKPESLVDFRYVDTSILIYPMFPGPHNLGTIFNVTVRLLAPVENATDLTMKVGLDAGITLLEGQTIWTGNLTRLDNYAIPMFKSGVWLPMKISFNQPGLWWVYCYVEKDGILIGGPRIARFNVTSSSISYSYNWGHLA